MIGNGILFTPILIANYFFLKKQKNIVFNISAFLYFASSIIYFTHPSDTTDEIFYIMGAIMYVISCGYVRSLRKEGRYKESRYYHYFLTTLLVILLLSNRLKF